MVNPNTAKFSTTEQDLLTAISRASHTPTTWRESRQAARLAEGSSGISKWKKGISARMVRFAGRRSRFGNVAEAGNPSWHMAIVQDTMSASRPRKTSEYERVVEGLEEMIVVVDRDYRYVIANRSF